MKNILSVFVFLLLAFRVSAQNKTEFGLSLNSGLFSFHGVSAENESSINNYSENNDEGYVNNPYGSKLGSCIGLSIDVKSISSVKFILGLDAGFEVLRSKIRLTKVYGNVLQNPLNAEGKANLNLYNLNAFPYMGYRLNNKYDILWGIDLSSILGMKENGKAKTDEGEVFKTSRDRSTIKADFRPRLQLSRKINNYRVYMGYSHGLVNYKKGFVGGTNGAYSSLIRFGAKYEMNNKGS